MKINLSEIYKGLKAWRDERRISVKSQKAGYIVNVMEELGELAQALRDFEKIKNASKNDYVGYYELDLEKTEHEIIDALCDIAIFTINAGAELRDKRKPLSFDIADAVGSLDYLLFNISTFDFKKVLFNCATLCKEYGFNFEIAMLETIKEISSRTGSYDENAKKWVKDDSEQARAKWYSANYELARI